MSPTAKLDDVEIRSRLRSVFSAPTYSRRKIVRPQPQLFNDITDWVNNGHATGRSPQAAELSPQTQSYIAEEFTPAAVYSQPQEAQASQTTISLPVQIQSQQLLSKPKPKFKNRFNFQIAFVIVAVFLLGGGGYITYSGWRDDNLVSLQARMLTAEANSKAVYTASTAKIASTTNPAPNSSNPVLVTKKPSIDYYDSFTVPPENPRYIKIPSLGVNTIVSAVGVTSSGALETPDNVYNTAWYDASAKPGQPGATLIDGHVSSWTAHGVFYGIKTLKTGDAIQIVKGDGSVVNYKVVSSQVYTSGNVNMQAAITPIVPGQSGLNLITCTGDVIPGTSQFNERIIVFASED